MARGEREVDPYKKDNRPTLMDWFNNRSKKKKEAAKPKAVAPSKVKRRLKPKVKKTAVKKEAPALKKVPIPAEKPKQETAKEKVSSTAAVAKARQTANAPKEKLPVPAETRSQALAAVKKDAQVQRAKDRAGRNEVYGPKEPSILDRVKADVAASKKVKPLPHPVSSKKPKGVPIKAAINAADEKLAAAKEGKRVRGMSTAENDSSPYSMADMKKMLGTDPTSTFPARPKTVAENNRGKVSVKEQMKRDGTALATETKEKANPGTSGKRLPKLIKLGDGSGLKKAREDNRKCAKSVKDAVLEKPWKPKKASYKWDRPYEKLTMDEMKKMLAKK